MTLANDAEQPFLENSNNIDRCIIVTEEDPPDKSTWNAELNRLVSQECAAAQLLPSHHLVALVQSRAKLCIHPFEEYGILI